MFILISCPVYKREWILPAWFEAIEAQDWPMDNLGFSFECAPNDEETAQCLIDFAAKHPELKCFEIKINNIDNHAEHPEGFRTWRQEHYHSMAKFRNNLLNRAVCFQPDRLFSLDSDIILDNPNTIRELVQLTSRPDMDAVSPLLYMMPDNIYFPNVMTWNLQLRGYRDPNYPIGTLFQADIIMAAVMMKKHVYTNVRYEWHPQGEDLGWSAQMKTKGYKMWSASYIYARHVMSRADLQIHKKTGDPRLLLLEEKEKSFTI